MFFYVCFVLLNTQLENVFWLGSQHAADAVWHLHLDGDMIVLATKHHQIDAVTRNAKLGDHLECKFVGLDRMNEILDDLLITGCQERLVVYRGQRHPFLDTIGAFPAPGDEAGGICELKYALSCQMDVDLHITIAVHHNQLCNVAQDTIIKVGPQAQMNLFGIHVCHIAMKFEVGWNQSRAVGIIALTDAE
ncbi:hypothetical protein BC831DRAFT_43154 [Entophlyctis helioformis]|nr:hypothetical protein BC831DRAFT_43154 [Entophlyctis helioformis]